VPTVTVATDEFLGLAQLHTKAAGLPHMQIVTVAHPIGGLEAEEVRAKARGAAEFIQSIRRTQPADAESAPGEVVVERRPRPRRAGMVDAGSSLDRAAAFCAEQGWTDGLPVVIPTRRRVADFVAASGLTADSVVAEIAPSAAPATVDLVAANAVMAGCRPEYMRVLVGAIQAVAEPEFKLAAIQATTHASGVLVLLNGPVVDELGINSGYGVFGPGNQANATIGRALRLVLWNVGGAKPGVGDRSTQGSPGKYTYCIAENTADSPWEPLHVEHSFAPSDSTVTVIACESPHNIQDHTSKSAVGVLTTVAGSMTELGSNHVLTHGGEPLLVLGPEHAATISKDGLSKQDVKQYLYERLRVRFDACSPDWHGTDYMEGRLRRDTGQAEWIPLVGSADDIWLIVAGGAGKHSSWIPTFGGKDCTKTIIRRLD
jgi:hypothetical protein